MFWCRLFVNQMANQMAPQMNRASTKPEASGVFHVRVIMKLYEYVSVFFLPFCYIICDQIYKFGT